MSKEGVSINVIVVAAIALLVLVVLSVVFLGKPASFERSKEQKIFLLPMNALKDVPVLENKCSEIGITFVRDLETNESVPTHAVCVVKS